MTPWEDDDANTAALSGASVKRKGVRGNRAAVHAVEKEAWAKALQARGVTPQGHDPNDRTRQVLAGLVTCFVALLAVGLGLYLNEGRAMPSPTSDILLEDDE